MGAPRLANALDFGGKVALVTGGARGVGRGIAERFLEAGAEVVICGRNAPEALPSFGGRSAAFFACDVRDAEQVARMVDAVATRFGRLDVLVANAGGAPARRSRHRLAALPRAIIQLNLIAPLHCAQRANAVMQSQPEGGVIELTSRASPRSARRRAPPPTAPRRRACSRSPQSLAVEWAPKVRVDAVTAGLIRTEQAHLHYGDEAGIAARRRARFRSAAWATRATSATPACSSPRRSRAT